MVDPSVKCFRLVASLLEATRLPCLSLVALIPFFVGNKFYITRLSKLKSPFSISIHCETLIYVNNLGTLQLCNVPNL